MATYQYQAKATEEFGVEFRSKLEAQWAYALTDKGIPWEYADSSWFDFTVRDNFQVEVKPLGAKFLEQAIRRAFKHAKRWYFARMAVFCGKPDDSRIFLLKPMSCGNCVAVQIGDSDFFIYWNKKSGFYLLTDTKESKRPLLGGKDGVGEVQRLLFK